MIYICCENMSATLQPVICCREKIGLDSWCVHQGLRQGLAAMSAMTLSSPVAEAWSQSEQLVSRASKGRLVICSGDCIGREDLIPNEEVISPVLGTLGLRTTVNCIIEHVEMFMHWARPRGKGSVNRPSTFALTRRFLLDWLTSFPAH